MEPPQNAQSQKRRQPFACVRGARIDLKPDPHGQRRVLSALDSAKGFGPGVLEAARVRLEAEPCGRKLGPGAGAGEEPASQGLLERGDAGRDGGLGHACAVGCPVKAAGLDEVEKGLNEVDLHGAH